MEDVVELGLAVDQVGEHLLAALAQVLRHPIQQLRMTDLVLHLAGQRQLAAQGGSAKDPLAFGQDAHQLGVGVHLDELQDRGPIVVGHPVVRLDLAAARDMRVEGFVSFSLVHAT